MVSMVMRLLSKEAQQVLHAQRRALAATSNCGIPFSCARSAATTILPDGSFHEGVSMAGMMRGIGANTRRMSEKSAFSAM